MPKVRWLVLGPARIFKPENFISGLNYYLPPDIAVKVSYNVNDKFNVQRDAVSREYKYIIFNSSTRSPLKEITLIR